jgi:solute carrier family 13 (sodium-dependent dicarboxylate transporter), member 2/3/5
VSPLVAVIAAVCLAVTFLTEVTSNTATANILLPVLGAAAKSAGFDPALLMIPAALSASCAFMLPVATRPNAVVFGSGRVRIADMALLGLVLNLIGVVVITLACWLLVPLVIGTAPAGG